MMKLYGAIDSHSNNSVIVLIDLQDKVWLWNELAKAVTDGTHSLKLPSAKAG
jgi:hypothetical protein